MFGLATIGALTFVPDKSWDSFPNALVPVRTRLANYGVAPARFCKDSVASKDFAVDDSEKVDERSSRAESEFSRRASASDRLETNVQIGGRSTSPNYEPDREDAGKSSAFDVGSFISESEDNSFDESFPSERRRGSESRFSGTSTLNDARVDESAVRSNDRDSAFAEDGFDRLNGSESSFNDVISDEPSFGSDGELDDILVDRSIADSFAEPDPYASRSPQNRVDSPQYADDFPSNVDAFPNVGATGSDVSTDSRVSAPVVSPTTERDLSSAIPNAAPSYSSDASSLDSQGYLSQNDASSATASYDDPQNYSTFNNAEPNRIEPSTVDSAVQSYEDYLNSQTSSLAQTASSSQSSFESNAGASYIPETSAVLNTSQSVSPSLNELLDAATAPRDEAKTRELFTSLNAIYRSRSVATPEDQKRLISALDRMAYDVFYDPGKSILEPPCQVRQGETLATIAREYDVTPELLAAINNLSVDANDPLPEGRLLKVVRGPVGAELSVSKKELLLSFNGYYAGRFRFGLPESALNLRGQFAVDSKIVKPSCDAVDMNGAKLTIPGGAENNPLGACWIGLKNGPGLQGTNRPELVGAVLAENGGFVFSNQEISQLNVLLPYGAVVSIVD